MSRVAEKSGLWPCRFGRQGGGQGPPRAVEVGLKATLQELYAGSKRKIKVTRRVPDPSDPNNPAAVKQEDEVLEIQIQPGWKAGTRITFQGKGDRLPGRPAQVRSIPRPYSRVGEHCRHSLPERRKSYFLQHWSQDSSWNSLTPCTGAIITSSLHYRTPFFLKSLREFLVRT